MLEILHPSERKIKTNRKEILLIDGTVTLEGIAVAEKKKTGYPKRESEALKDIIGSLVIIICPLHPPRKPEIINTYLCHLLLLHSSRMKNPPSFFILLYIFAPLDAKRGELVAFYSWSKLTRVKLR